jgi:hypothetical protein
MWILTSTAQTLSIACLEAKRQGSHYAQNITTLILKCDETLISVFVCFGPLVEVERF